MPARSSSCDCTAATSRSVVTTPGSGSARRGECSTSPTPTSGSGRRSSTWTCGTRSRSRRRRGASASQRWHRDFNDQHLLKAFLYLVDVDEGTGPFEYIPGSAPGGQYAHEWPWRPLGETYPPEGALEERIPADAIKTFTGPKGTLLFCNTSGFHRGGFATEQAARPRDRDLRVSRIAQVADRPELRVHGIARRARRADPLRRHLTAELGCQLTDPLERLDVGRGLRLRDERRIRAHRALPGLVPEVEERRVGAGPAAP